MDTNKERKKSYIKEWRWQKNDIHIKYMTKERKNWKSNSKVDKRKNQYPKQGRWYEKRKKEKNEKYGGKKIKYKIYCAKKEDASEKERNVMK